MKERRYMGITKRENEVREERDGTQENRQRERGRGEERDQRLED